MTKLARDTRDAQAISDLYNTVLSEVSVDYNRPMAAQIYQAIRRAIVQNKLPPGTPIFEAKFSEVIGVSRTPLRAALQQLAKEDLIETRPQVGSIVAPIDREKISSAVFCRSALETAVVRHLVAQPSFDPKPFRRILAQQQEFSTSDDYVGFFDVDEGFHALLAESAGVPEAWQLIRSRKTHVDRARLSLQSAIPGRAAAAYQEHLGIIEAIEHGDADLAANLMNKHVRSVLDII